ncbi:MAG: hypothetical protein JWO44_626 [Bacteroidetes bacterium]|nr:hypothetical protein [Bacteroidota bacterium]
MRNMFLKERLTVERYEATMVDLLRAYDTPLDHYKEVNTFRYSKWSIAIEDIGQLITFQDYLEIIKRPRFDRKFFFYDDSDYYIFYSMNPRTQQWELGIGKDPSRSIHFNLMTE